MPGLPAGHFFYPGDPGLCVGSLSPVAWPKPRAIQQGRPGGNLRRTLFRVWCGERFSIPPDAYPQGSRQTGSTHPLLSGQGVPLALDLTPAPVGLVGAQCLLLDTDTDPLSRNLLLTSKYKSLSFCFHLIGSVRLSCLLTRCAAAVPLRSLRDQACRPVARINKGVRAG